MKWPWKHFKLSIRYQRLTGLIETYLGWAASWNSGRWKSPSKHLNVPSTAERRQKIAAKHHGIYEISTFARRRLEVCNKGIWDVRTQAYQIRSEYRQRWRKVHQSWFLISRLSCILAHSSELMTNGSHEQENEGGGEGGGKVAHLAQEQDRRVIASVVDTLNLPFWRTAWSRQCVGRLQRGLKEWRVQENNHLFQTLVVYVSTWPTRGRSPGGYS